VAVSGFEFGGEIREIIHRFKYQGHVCLAPFLAESMCLNWARFGAGLPDVMVPVPMHRWKELWRGYNQAELLARQISQLMNLPLCCGLRRTGRQRQQAQLRVEERQENVRNAFRATSTGRLADRHVLLVDDVFTTGATLTAATVALRAAGVRQVSVLTVAKG
jgi:ComF family protein